MDNQKFSGMAHLAAIIYSIYSIKVLYPIVASEDAVSSFLEIIIDSWLALVLCMLKQTEKKSL